MIISISRHDKNMESALVHHFDECVALVWASLLLDHGRKPPQQAYTNDYESIRRDFIFRLNRVLELGASETANVKRQDLQNMIRLAEIGNWSDLKTIRELYRAYYRIMGEEFDEETFFPSRIMEPERNKIATTSISKKHGICPGLLF